MNTPNKISIGRISLIPIFLFFLTTDFIPFSRIIALIIFAIAGMTDSIDGYIARKTNQITTLGKFLDPLADKLLITSALIGFVQLGLCNSWFAVIILAREFIVTSFRIIAINKNVIIAADKWGKIKTTMQILAVMIVIVADYIGAPKIIGFISLAAATLVTVLSGYNYLRKNWEIISDNK